MNRHQPRRRPDERVRIPADVDREDRLLGNLTARQLAILAAAALVLWVGWAATRRLLPLPVFAALAAPFAGVGSAIGGWPLAWATRRPAARRDRPPAADAAPAHPRPRRHPHPDRGANRCRC